MNKLYSRSVLLNSRNLSHFEKIFRKCSTEPLSKEDLFKKRRAEIMAKGLPRCKPIENVKHIILVSSGKGGVGKSTVAVNLATSIKLIEPDKNVGLLDADVFGPSIPLMMNLHDTPILNERNLMVPLLNYGVQCMSMGFLISEGSPVIWRGLMVMQALDKLLRQVIWDSVDYLIVDTPPGTGDTHLSLVQNVPISGVVLVTTPHKAALQVTKRGAEMYKKLNVPIIGLVENMSEVVCPSCSENIKMFGKGTSALASDIGKEILASFPINEAISESSDCGVPLVTSNPNSEESKSYLKLAQIVMKFSTEIKS